MKHSPNYATVVIDARPSFEGELAAFFRIGPETIVERHFALAKKLSARDIFILEEPSAAFSSKISNLSLEGARICSHLPPDPAALILSTLHVYRRHTPQIVWTLRNKEDLKNAEGEATRSEFFTISKYTLRPLGKIFANWLYSRTGFTANHLTLARIAVGLLGALLFFQGEYGATFLAGICVLTSWFLDLTDGQLARLRNESSKFGAYLDSVGDGVIDNLYYLAIAVSSYRLTGSEIYLWLALLFLFGKYVFVNSTLLLPIVLTKEVRPKEPQRDALPSGGDSWKALIKKTVSVLDDTDVRIHFLSLSAIFNLAVVPLVFHVIYFNLRWMMNLANAYYKYELKKEAN